MHFEILPTKRDVKVCDIHHGGKTIPWDVSYFVKAKSLTSVVDDEVVPVPSDLFKYHNQWIANMSQDKQDKLFDLYSQAKELVTHCDDHDRMYMGLRDVIRQILDFESFATVHLFIRLRTDIQDPLSVKDEFEEDAAGRNKKNKTYVKKQYQELVTLTFLMRLVMPIWGEYLFRVGAYTDSSDMEMSAFDLMLRADLMNSEAMQFLKGFVDNTIPPDTNKSAALIDGISTDDYGKWLLSLAVLRRLTVGSLQDSGELQGPTLVSFIYKYVRTRALNDPNFSGFIKDKKHSVANDADPNALSTLEEHRVKEPFSAGDIALVKQELLDPIDLYWKLCIGLDETESKRFEPIDEVNDEFKELLTEPIGIAQITFLQYVVSPLMSHRLLYDVHNEQSTQDPTREPIYNAMRAASAYLKRLGLLEQAIIMTAVRHYGKGMNSSPSTAKRQFTPEMQSRLSQLFPYDRKTKSHHDKVDTRTSYDVAFDAIETHLRRSEWRITLPQSDVAQFNGGSRASRVYTCHAGIKAVLAEFFIAMNDSAKRIRTHRKLFLENLLK